MTTGYRTIGTSDGYSGLPYFYREWSGGNGKYLPGTTRLKRNNYSCELISAQFTRGSGRYINCGFGDRVDWTKAPPNFQLNLVDKLNGRLKGFELSLGNDLVTVNQTIDLCLATFRRFVGCVKHLKKGNIPAAVRALGAAPRGKHRRALPGHQELSSKDVSSFWLEMRYGWEPLISDVYEISKVMETVNNRPRHFKATVTGRYTTSWVQSGYLNGYWTASGRGEYSRRITAYAEELISVSRSLGLQDPASMAWEILPWSFVVDWFIPVGTYLQALEQTPNFRAVYETIDYAAVKSTASGVGVYAGARTSVLYLKTSRIYSNSLAIPQPEFTAGFSLRHFENGLALFHQQMHRLMK